MRLLKRWSSYLKNTHLKRSSRQQLRLVYK